MERTSDFRARDNIKVAVSRAVLKIKIAKSRFYDALALPSSTSVRNAISAMKYSYSARPLSSSAFSAQELARCPA